MSHEPSDILLTCTWVCVRLDGCTCSECLPVMTCEFEPPERAPRTSTRAHTCAVVFGRAPCVPRSQEHEKRIAARREINAEVQKISFIQTSSSFYINIYPWYTFILERCSLSGLEPFFGDFSAARPRLVVRLAPSDSPQPRGPCPRAGPPSPRLYAQR